MINTKVKNKPQMLKKFFILGLSIGLGFHAYGAESSLNENFEEGFGKNSKNIELMHEFVKKRMAV